jgi:hypothetical protein
MPDFLLWVAVAIIFFTSIGLLISRDWRTSLVLLAIQYLGMFLIIGNHWLVTMAAAKLITGWMVAASLGMTLAGQPEYSTDEKAWPEGLLFRLFVSALVVIAAISIAPNIIIWIPGIQLSEAIGGMILIGMGLLQLGITIQPLRVTLGLLTILCGFETLYSSVENSLLVAALLSVINLGLALIGAYLIISAEPPAEEEL